MANMRMAESARHSTPARVVTPVKKAASGTRWISSIGAEFFQSTCQRSTVASAFTGWCSSYLLVGRQPYTPGPVSETRGDICELAADTSGFRWYPPPVRSGALQTLERALQQVFLLQLV